MLVMTLCSVTLIVLIGSYYAYRIAFYSPIAGRDQVVKPKDPQYDPYRPEMRRIYQNLSSLSLIHI